MICKNSVKLLVFVCSWAVFQWRTAAHPQQLSLLVNTCQGDCGTRNKKQSLDMSRHIRQIHRVRGFAMVSHKHSRPCIPLLCAVRLHHHSAPAGTNHGWVWLNRLRCGNHCVWIFSSSTYAEPHVLHVVLSSSAASYRSYSMSWAWHRAQMSLSVQRLHFSAAWVNFQAILQDFHLAPPNRWFPWEGPVGQVKTVVPFAHALHHCSVSSGQMRCKSYVVDANALLPQHFETLSALCSQLPRIEQQHSEGLRGYRYSMQQHNAFAPRAQVPRPPWHQGSRKQKRHTSNLSRSHACLFM